MAEMMMFLGALAFGSGVVWLICAAVVEDWRRGYYLQRAGLSGTFFIVAFLLWRLS